MPHASVFSATIAMPPFAANLSTMFREWPFLDRFQAAADAGFLLVECQFPYDDPPELIANRVAQNGVSFTLFNTPPGDSTRELGFAALEGRETDFRASVDRALDLAGLTGTRKLHVVSGKHDSKDARALGIYKDNLSWAAERARPQGIDLVIEPINPRDIPGYFMNDFAMAAAIITDVNAPNLKLLFDIYHRQIIMGDVLRGLQDLMPIISHVQIASVPTRAEPGTGELDDNFVLSALKGLGYTGAVGCEYVPAVGTLEGLSWLSRFSQAR